MGKRTRLDVIADAVSQHAGEAVCRAVMQDAESATTPVKSARWVKAAMERLDSLVDEPTRTAVMAQCGKECAWPGKAKKIADLKKRAGSYEEFLTGLAQVFHIEPGDGVIYVIYPRCYCGLVKATKEPISATYCQCSRSFITQAFSVGLQRDVQVDVLQTVMQGAESCRFAVHLSADIWA